VRIQEVAFPPDAAEVVVAAVRDRAALRYGGEGFHGFRLLVDRGTGRALDVSYWETEGAARAAADAPEWPVLRTDHYELSVDSA
jgi:heme-degrading monooxygenase HmoA